MSCTFPSFLSVKMQLWLLVCFYFVHPRRARKAWLYLLGCLFFFSFSGLIKHCSRSEGFFPQSVSDFSILWDVSYVNSEFDKEGYSSEEFLSIILSFRLYRMPSLKHLFDLLDFSSKLRLNLGSYLKGFHWILIFF